MVRQLTRRRFLRLCTAWAAGTSALLSGCAGLFKSRGESIPFDSLTCEPHDGDEAFDYVIVGSGAGGGPLAANLARAGYRVLLLEAGGDEEPYNYQVPAFHPHASEDERLRWDFFVRHYADEAQQRRDDKFCPAQDGVLYPRAGTLGGCTAHNALIIVYPHNSDWDHIAEVTGDESWRSERMRGYFQRLERCAYVERGETASRHGFSGWLATNVADPMLVVRDRLLRKLTAAASLETFRELGGPVTRVLPRLANWLDPNDWRLVKEDSEGLCVTPMSTHQGRRNGPREYIGRTRQACPDHLVVRTHALATRVLLDESNRATGVEYLSGADLYRAAPRSVPEAPYDRHTVTARREVILCGGAFNTPQLLKLSGIGPRAELERHGIPVRVDRPGVGENLQDRYEISVVTRLKEEFELIKDMIFRAPAPGEAPDPQFEQWLQGEGPYTSNGVVVSLIRRSFPQRPAPDLFIFGLLGRFDGYFPGYSQRLAEERDTFTWAILKAHTDNTAGRVLLRSADPQDVPYINFHYFYEGTDQDGDDLAAVVEGVQAVRRILERSAELVDEEILPGPRVRTPEEIRRFVKDNAWGHHASCTCKMGAADDPMAVVDSRFRVFGARNLRVVDASVFPKIPGFFIVTPTYMISEKASDVIIADARRGSHQVTHSGVSR